MAEGFARKYGSDVLHAWSAGLAPASIMQPQTIDVMLEKNVDISDQFPKSVDELELDAFDVIFNMSGLALPVPVRGDVRIWNVADPMLQSEAVYIKVRDQIEGLVMHYILELRRASKGSAPVTKSSNPVTMPAFKEKSESPDPPRRFGFGRVRKARDGDD